MEKYRVLNQIITNGVVAVIRAKSDQEAILIAKACLDGGIHALEVTFTVPKANLVIEQLKDTFSQSDLLIGAGTVLDEQTARIAILSGADFIVSPSFDEATAKCCNRYGVPYLPGCMTITEMVKAMEFGCDLLKVFPGNVLGPQFIKSVLGPLPHVHLMPTGGVSLDNVEEWIQAGVSAIGIGSELTAPAKVGNFPDITQRAKAFVEAIHQARKK